MARDVNRGLAGKKTLKKPIRLSPGRVIGFSLTALPVKIRFQMPRQNVGRVKKIRDICHDCANQNAALF
jgi:hypothetical protein